MPRIAFVFPGQGAQYPGMGKELSLNFEEAADVFSQADNIAGYSMRSLCFDDSAGQLSLTEFSQPALLVSSLAAFEAALASGLKPTMMAGLSLGEYSALVASGSLDLTVALPLVQVRGQLMQNAVPPNRGSMAAVLGADPALVEKTCQEVDGVVSIANYNCPGQVVVSGEREAVEEVTRHLKDQGVRVIPLAVSVPSHSPLMFDAAMQLKLKLAEVSFKEGDTPVVSNVNAHENQAADLIDLLTRQLYQPVRWEESIRYMMQNVDYFVEIGPGSTLSGLIKKIDRNKILGNIEDMRSLDKTLKKVNAL